MDAVIAKRRTDFKLRLGAAYRAKRAMVEASGGTYNLRQAARNIVAASTPPGVVINQEKAEQSWRRHLQRYLNGQHLPTGRVLSQLAAEFECRPEDLLDTDDTPRSVEAMFSELMRRLDRIEQRERSATAA